MKRIKSLDSGEKVPNDILTHILKVASKCITYSVCACNEDAVYIGTNESADIETLVDDFVTFYVAGEASLSVCFCVFHSFRIFNIQVRRPLQTHCPLLSYWFTSILRYWRDCWQRLMRCWGAGPLSRLRTWRNSSTLSR